MAKVGIVMGSDSDCLLYTSVSNIQEVTQSVVGAVDNLAGDSARLLEFVGTDVVQNLSLIHI